MIIGQRVLSVNPLQVEFTVIANATINGNINATTVSTIQPNGVFQAKGQGFIMTQDGEVATYNSQVTGNVTIDGLKIGWDIVRNDSGTASSRLQALALINDSYKYLMDLTTNGVVITDAIKFVQTNKEKLISAKSKEKEDDGKESNEPDEEDQDQLEEK
jgi:hypothetical protein